MTKNSDKNSSITRSGAQLHPELALPNTNQRKEYQATLHYTQYCYATVRIIAKSQVEAEKKADAIERDSIRDWKLADGDFCVYAVELVEEGQSHE